jgi:hypothetical protein
MRGERDGTYQEKAGERPRRKNGAAAAERGGGEAVSLAGPPGREAAGGFGLCEEMLVATFFLGY